MKPTKHPQCNDVLRAPAGSTDCDDLHIRREDGEVWSFWEPNTEELAAMALGGPVMLRVCGSTHPPLSLHVMQPEAGQTVQVPEANFRHLYDYSIAQGRRLLNFAKRTLSAWTRDNAGGTERQKFLDELLDMMNEWKGGEIVKEQTEPNEELTARLEMANVVAESWEQKCKTAEAARDTERELRIAAEANLKSLASYAAGGLGQPVSGIAVIVSDEIVRLRKLSSSAMDVPALRDEIERLRAEVLSLEAVVDRVKEAINPTES